MKNNSKFDRAVVIGGSMAGLLAARVLSDFYGETIVLERDELKDAGEQRRGVPHGRHAHAILAGGLQVIEELFPGISDELIAGGALLSDPLKDGRWFFEGGDLARSASGTDSIMSSRPFLEDGVRKRVRRLARVKILDNQSVRQLVTENGRVIGIQTDNGMLEADLVVDAAGRGSQTPQWLESMGFHKPPEERVEVQLAYTTRIFRRRPRHMNGDDFVVVNPTPEGKRGGVVLAKENNEWIVTLFGFFGNKAPEDLAGYIDYAGSLAAPYIHELVSQAEPIGDAERFNFPASVRRRYEKVPGFPEGLLVFGDAICSFNPAYGQGMSSASLQAIALRDTLAGSDKNLARRFFSRAAKVIDNPWSIAVGGDLKMPEATGHRGLDVKLINWYMGHLHRRGHNHVDASLAFVRVAQLLDPPTSLMRPSMIVRVLAGALRRWISRSHETSEQILRSVEPARRQAGDGF